MRNQTINVLNKADSIQRRMDWMLFVQEQDMRLFGHEDGWGPGDPIHKRPGHGGWLVHGDQYVRDMIEDIDIEAFNSLPEVYYPRNWCQPCEVLWESDEPCFVCGTQYPAPKKPLPIFMGERQMPIFMVERQMQIYATADATLTQAIYSEIRRRLDDRLDEMLGLGTARFEPDVLEFNLLSNQREVLLSSWREYVGQPLTWADEIRDFLTVEQAPETPPEVDLTTLRDRNRPNPQRQYPNSDPDWSRRRPRS